MVHLALPTTWHDIRVWDGWASIAYVAYRGAKAAPRVTARILVPVLKFVASTTGSYEIKEYLHGQYPKRPRKNSRSSSD